jgi:hypothetical protein
MFLIKQKDPSFRESYNVNLAGRMDHSGTIEHEHKHNLAFDSFSEAFQNFFSQALTPKLVGSGNGDGVEDAGGDGTPKPLYSDKPN